MDAAWARSRSRLSLPLLQRPSSAACAAMQPLPGLCPFEQPCLDCLLVSAGFAVEALAAHLAPIKMLLRHVDTAHIWGTCSSGLMAAASAPAPLGVAGGAMGGTGATGGTSGPRGVDHAACNHSRPVVSTVVVLAQHEGDTDA